MANKNIEQFIATYGPVAVQVSKEINVDPNVLLSQWGLESRWGQTEMAKKYHNLGGIKDFSGNGLEAKDNKTGSVDKYVKFEDPEVFGMYYVDQIKRNFPNALNTGPDAGAFTRGLASGKRGSYFEVPIEEYEKSLSSAQASIPESKMLPFEPTAQPKEKPEQRDGDLQLGDAPPPPPPPPPASDKSSAGAGEKFLFGGAGAAFGTAAAGKGAYDTQKTANLVKRAGLEERARIAAQRSAGVVPPAAPSVPTTAPTTTPPLGSTIMRQTPPAVGGLTPPMGPADAGRMPQGQTGVIPYNTAKALGVTDIEAGQALTNTKQQGGAWDIATKRAEALNKLQGMGMGNFAENPMYGGIMTEQPSVGRGPRESFTMRAPVAPSPDLPQGQQGGLSQLPPRQAIPTAPPPPPPPSTGMRARAGLDWITGKLADMMKPVASVTSKYVLPPLGGLSAGLDVADIAHEYRKPVDQRDLVKMGLKSTGALGGVLSMFPASAPFGVPLSIGSTAAQAYRENPEWLRKKMEGLANTPLLDEMTGPTP